MRKISVILMILCVGFTFAQEKPQPKLEKKGDLTEATYFHDNGEVEQIGTFNEEGKLHGTWTSFDKQGNKVAVGKYDNGKKVGKWFFWADETLKEVDYVDSKIVSVSKWGNKTNVAVRN